MTVKIVRYRLSLMRREPRDPRALVVRSGLTLDEAMLFRSDYEVYFPECYLMIDRIADVR